MCSKKKKTISEMEGSIEEIRLELEALRMNSRREGLRSRLKLEELRGRNAEAQRALDKILDRTSRRVHLHEYAAAIQKAKGEQQFVSQYVVSYEAQVCRAIHHMSSAEHQHAILQRYLHDLRSIFDSYKTQLLQEKALCQKLFEPSLEQLLNEHRSLEANYKRVVAPQEAEIVRLRQELGETDKTTQRLDEKSVLSDLDKDWSSNHTRKESCDDAAAHDATESPRSWKQRFVHGLVAHAQQTAERLAAHHQGKMNKKETKSNDDDQGKENKEQGNTTPSEEKVEETRIPILSLRQISIRRKNQRAGSAA